MKEVERIGEQLKRAFEGSAWHGPSVLEVLADVAAEKARARPLAGAHNIWEIVLHIAAWEGAARRRLTGDRAELSPEEDWPPVMDTSDDAWNQTLELLKTSHEQLRKELSGLADSRLENPIVEGASSVYATLHGVIQHDIYHAGQIALLKKGA